MQRAIPSHQGKKKSGTEAGQTHSVKRGEGENLSMKKRRLRLFLERQVHIAPGGEIEAGVAGQPEHLAIAPQCIAKVRRQVQAGAVLAHREFGLAEVPDADRSRICVCFMGGNTQLPCHEKSLSESRH
jgi:hypothetical protein